MTNTIDTAVSTVGDAFQALTLDSARVSTHSVASLSSDTLHDLGEDTTLIMISVGTEGAGVLVYRGDGFTTSKAWHLRPGDHPFNVPGGSRTLRFRAVDELTTVKILEN